MRLGQCPSQSVHSRSPSRPLMGWLIAIGMLNAAAATQAQFLQPDPLTDGWSRFDPSSSYAQWDFFFFISGGNPPDVGLFPNPLPTGWVDPDVRETTGTAFVTSTGNMYSFETVLEWEATMPGQQVPGLGAVVLIQTRTLGRELDPVTMTVNGQGPVLVTELFRAPFGGIFGGDTVDTLWRFELPSSAPVYTWIAAALDTSVSLDALVIDTFPREIASCRFDFNNDQVVDGIDLLEFLDLLEAGDPLADVDMNSAVDFFDLLVFLNEVGPC
jgi:hypothetical protein